MEWNDPQDPSRGFKHLYLTDKDYNQLVQTSDVAPLKASPTVNHGRPPSQNLIIMQDDE